MCTYTGQYSCMPLLSQLRGSEATKPQQQLLHWIPEITVSRNISRWRTGILGEMADSRTGIEIYKLSLYHLIMPGNPRKGSKRRRKPTMKGICQRDLEANWKSSQWRNVEQIVTILRPKVKNEHQQFPHTDKDSILNDNKWRRTIFLFRRVPIPFYKYPLRK